MINQTLTKSFQAAINDLEKHKYAIPQMRTVSNNFVYSYNTAVGMHDDAAKRATVEAFADFIFEAINVKPKLVEDMQWRGEAVELLCATLNKTVADKSLIPANFAANLLKAAQKVAAPGWRAIPEQYARAQDTANKIARLARFF